MGFFVPNSIFFLVNKNTKIFCQPQTFATANFAHLTPPQNVTFRGVIFDYAQVLILSIYAHSVTKHKVGG